MNYIRYELYWFRQSVEFHWTMKTCLNMDMKRCFGCGILFNLYSRKDTWAQKFRHPLMYMNVCRCLSKDFAFVFVLKTYVFQNIVFHLELNLVVQKNLQIIIQTNKSVYKILTNDTFGFTCFLLSPFSSYRDITANLTLSPSLSIYVQLPPTPTRIAVYFSQ